MIKVFIIMASVGLFLVSGCTQNGATAFEEKDWVVAVEAENFDRQRNDEIRRWYITSEEVQPEVLPDGDPAHYQTASNSAYVEVLPDTRRTHDDTLKHGINFSNAPGRMAILDYNVYFNTPGKYYVWVRAFSTGSEDNGLHVGINGNWPESGSRLQWCDGKDEWTWESNQRTAEVHCGEPEKIWIDVPEKGLHTISFSMREDGFEFDKWVMSQRYEKPQGTGPKESDRK